MVGELWGVFYGEIKNLCHYRVHRAANNKVYRTQWIPAVYHPQKFSIFVGPEGGMTRVFAGAISYVVFVHYDVAPIPYLKRVGNG